MDDERYTIYGVRVADGGLGDDEVISCRLDPGMNGTGMLLVLYNDCPDIGMLKTLCGRLAALQMVVHRMVRVVVGQWSRMALGRMENGAKYEIGDEQMRYYRQVGEYRRTRGEQDRARCDTVVRYVPWNDHYGTKVVCGNSS